jgi:hypothetical protein
MRNSKLLHGSIRTFFKILSHLKEFRSKSNIPHQLKKKSKEKAFSEIWNLIYQVVEYKNPDTLTSFSAFVIYSIKKIVAASSLGINAMRSWTKKSYIYILLLNLIWRSRILTWEVCYVILFFKFMVCSLKIYSMTIEEFCGSHSGILLGDLLSDHWGFP